jgi:hypothetical protein
LLCVGFSVFSFELSDDKLVHTLLMNSIPIIPLQRFGLALLVLVAATAETFGQDKVFSGPQPGEKTTPFKVVEVRGPKAGQERDPITENKGAATVLVFVHGIERSMTPILTVIDQYGTEKKAVLKTEFVFLSGDRVASEKQLPLVGQSLRLQSPMSLSLDGVEGPGNYGLNKSCLLTVVVAKENKATANFALVQPGIADAPRIIEAIAKVAGDTNPPTAEAFRTRRQELYGGATTNRMGEAKRMAEARPKAAAAKQELPGAAPTDDKLLGLLRKFIQKANDDATVDGVLQEVQAYIKGNPELTKQAIDGWTRVIFLKYGTDYAQKTGQAMVEKLKQ